jgi:quaternary ammonium compound-resistance protein SugE
MPGCSEFLINQAIKYADRVSVNLEIPNLSGLHKLCPQKKEEFLLNPMIYIHNKILENRYQKGQTTQLIVGATSDNDFQILKLSENFSNWIWSVGFFISISLSFYFLNKSLISIPIGTAYAIWTGIGAIGTAIIGIILFKESTDFWRIFFLVILIFSIIGLKIVS